MNIRIIPVTNKYWETKEGKLIRLEDMEDRHLNNAINMLNRNLRNGSYEMSMWDEEDPDCSLKDKKESDLTDLIEERLRRETNESHTSK